jgi:MFS family permease
VSEIWGRRIMYTISALCWLLLTIGIARAQNPATVIICRALAGCAASPGSTLVGGSIADLWLTFERDPAMLMFSVFAFFGNGIGQCVSGWIEQTLGWRWIQYLLLILIGVECLALTFLTQETRGSYILSKRAARLRKETGDNRYQCRADAERASVGTLVRQSLSRPVVFLLTEPIVTMLALWFGFAWGKHLILSAPLNSFGVG